MKPNLNFSRSQLDGEKFLSVVCIHLKFIFHLTVYLRGLFLHQESPLMDLKTNLALLFPEFSSILEVAKEKIITKMRWNSTLQPQCSARQNLKALNCKLIPFDLILGSH